MNSIKSISFNYISPFEITLEKVAFNEAVNLFVGPNGSGKSLLLVHAYMGTTILSMIAKGADPWDAAELVVSKSLDGYEEFTGSFNITMKDGSLLDVTIDEGKVTVDFHAICDGGIAPMRYMSSGMRTFKPIHQYLTFRKSIANGKGELNPEGMGKMLEFFKMYDASYIEALIAHCPITLPEGMKDYDFDDDDYPVALDVNLFSGEFHVITVKGNTQSVLRYGSGHQAILNMMAGVNI